jgi:hypothetical protein
MATYRFFKDGIDYTFIFVLDQSRLLIFLNVGIGVCQNNKIKIVRTASVKFDIIIKY